MSSPAPLPAACPPLAALPKRTLRHIGELAEAGLAPADPALEAVAARYAVAVTPTLIGLIDPTDAADPIARQFVPDARELETRPEERGDPIGDGAHSPVPGIVHRYPDRALLKLVGVCAVYCRFCFRREMVGPGAETSLTDAELDAALGYIAARPEIWEVVLTGGDPLVLAPRRLAALMARLAAIAHVKVVRFHTRVPIAAPERVTPALVEAIRAPDVTTYVAVHANHARELGPEARAALARLADAGVALVGQSVLLAGVNDEAATLAALFRTLVECRVKPYYLHHPDLAPGTAHFRLPIERGQALMAALRGRVSGLALPTYVLDIPGGHGKVPIGPGYLEPAPDGWRVTDYCGGVHSYGEGV
ncbi:lysine-2,3-aminomutase-like protein [Ancylobacter dichloromethanicus]|uniref:Lysine 2,3-aminomutase n=1 Tax=Ancylobacter dichloromethanicus TaxID=518825 RepID=A0A9W6J5E3_9HYPH|nr:lysine-2,3-aminomutase-like protein [Ancylobacter dichloromethanicus]MBS7554018.1 lysine-2,3-aminomutase-like protein [Ancylobacter dichloromethanicus]GLK71131.1 lysine 2,3-aminomutase [Ancylobacter dichloromethanicus]